MTAQDVASQLPPESGATARARSPLAAHSRSRSLPPLAPAAAPPQDRSPHQLSLFMTVRFDCGHSAEVPSTKSYKPGDWTSCWAVMHPQQGCQTQRKVTEVIR